MLYVEWVDSACLNGWLLPSDIDAAGSPTTCASAGFLVKETKTSLVLALNRGVSENVARPFGEVVTIPKVSITKRVRLA